ncbi:ExbD/TolR family protein [Nubsella zeaxanthinifaciens]|uniref:ExbD/TolR family protein n=1 Tax=Nubsella zeaxanthinifaciens TaxID=392412 RepID=UPI003CFFCEBA
MATLNVPQNGKAVKGSTRKPVMGVDLTAMVDLAFLLITFFMLTTSLGKMNAMDIAKPDTTADKAVRTPYPASKTMTILLGKDNQLVFYMGEASNSLMKVANLSQIRKAILQQSALIAKDHQNSKFKDLYVIIKPTNSSVYSNFVDILDEMHINKIKSYAIDDKYILDEEKSFMKAKGI